MQGVGFPSPGLAVLADVAGILASASGAYKGSFKGCYKCSLKGIYRGLGGLGV